MKHKFFVLMVILPLMVGTPLVHAQTWTKAFAFNDPYGNLLNINFTYYREMVYGETYPFEVRIDITNLHAGDRIHLHTATIEVPNFTVDFAIAAEFTQTGQAETFTLGFYATDEAKNGQMHLRITYTTFISGGQYNGERTEYIDNIIFKEKPAEVPETPVPVTVSTLLVGTLVTSVLALKRRYLHRTPCWIRKDPGP